jgi:hypothetical protein
VTIPEDQLERWSHQGATVASPTAYQAIRNAIGSSAALEYRQVEVYLQGSYKNDTNIRGDSDVDVVVQSDQTFFYDLSKLPEGVQATVKATISPAYYQWGQFRQNVLDALTDYFGNAAVVDRSKCMTVTSAGGSGISADVVPAFTHRLYVSGATGHYLEGIAFKTQREDRVVVNYPKRHHEKGVEKNQQTGGEFKPTVRMFKNARSLLVERGWLDEKTAPPFFIECMLFNVNSVEFPATTWQKQFAQVYNFLDSAQLGGFACPNGVVPLFGPSPEQWSIDQARELLVQLSHLWNDW